MARCPEHDLEGMGRYVGWGIITANLAKIAQAVASAPDGAGDVTEPHPFTDRPAHPVFG